MSSINSDTKIGQNASGEPYYDTVPNELSDDKSDDDNKNFKPESPERASNYVNIDYFLKWVIFHESSNVIGKMKKPFT